MNMLRTLMAVVNDFYQYFNPRKTPNRYRFLALVVVLVGAAFFIFGGNGETEEATTLPKTVLVGSVSSLQTSQSIALVGTVESINQANLETEAGGRVTAVNVTLGQSVGAGATIATLENAAQYASLLQAQGAYEGALAAAAVSDVSVGSAAVRLTEAKNSARSAFTNAYNTANAVLISNVNSIYTDPESAFPGVRIDGGSDTAYLNSARIELQRTMPAWLAETQTISSAEDLNVKLDTAIARIDSMSALVDTISSNLNRDPVKYANTPYAGLAAALNADRAALSAARSNLTNQQAALKQAEDALRQAELGGTGSTVSAANAQVKQALGVLRAAEAAYNKTIIRTPIAGVVNTLDLKVGDFVGSNVPAATIANNNALEITTFVGEQDLESIAVGDTVLIEDRAEGTITAIAPAINPATKKVEVKIQTESADIANGDTVRITLKNGSTNTPATEGVSGPLFVPLTSVKFTAENGAMFTVVNGVLESRPVTLGRISGDAVEITSGIDATTEFVIDARGLSNGQRVEAVVKK